MGARIAAATLALLVAGCSLFTPILGGNKGAYLACTRYVAQRFGISAAEAQVYSAAATISRPESGDYLVEVLYPKRQSAYRCDVMEVVSGEWALVRVERVR